MNKKYIIGLSSVATAGKDTFCKLVIDELYKHGYMGQRFALADKLKQELHQFLLDKFGVDLFDCTPEEKELIRPMLVAYGKVWRDKSEGQHWTSLLKKEIEASECDVAIVTDIRYDRFPKDELEWIKETMGGILVHISRFDIVNGTEVFIKPPNEDEASEDPKMIQSADFRVQWETGNAEGQKKVVKEFLSKFALPLIERSC